MDLPLRQRDTRRRFAGPLAWRAAGGAGGACVWRRCRPRARRRTGGRARRQLQSRTSATSRRSACTGCACLPHGPILSPHSGDYSANWIANYERLFSQLPPGTKVIVDVVGTPQWETGSTDEHTPPANPEDYAAFVGGLAQRFGSHVAAYELWNEEDSPSWWVGAPDPAAYAALLKASYPVIKAAEPNATVLVGRADRQRLPVPRRRSTRTAPRATSMPSPSTPTPPATSSPPTASCAKTTGT